MAITAALVTALGGGKIDYVPITPNAKDFEVTLPAGTWLVQIEVSGSAGASGSSAATAGGVESTVPTGSSVLLTRVVSGGTLTGSVTNKSRVKYTHGIAIRLGD